MLPFTMWILLSQPSYLQVHYWDFFPLIHPIWIQLNLYLEKWNGTYKHTIFSLKPHFPFKVYYTWHSTQLVWKIAEHTLIFVAICSVCIIVVHVHIIYTPSQFCFDHWFFCDVSQNIRFVFFLSQRICHPHFNVHFFGLFWCLLLIWRCALSSW